MNVGQLTEILENTDSEAEIYLLTPQGQVFNLSKVVLEVTADSEKITHIVNLIPDCGTSVAVEV